MPTKGVRRRDSWRGLLGTWKERGPRAVRGDVAPHAREKFARVGARRLDEKGDTRDAATVEGAHG